MRFTSFVTFKSNWYLPSSMCIPSQGAGRKHGIHLCHAPVAVDMLDSGHPPLNIDGGDIIVPFQSATQTAVQCFWLKPIEPHCLTTGEILRDHGLKKICIPGTGWISKTLVVAVVARPWQCRYHGA